MKNLAVVFAVLVSSFGFGQSDTNPELQKMIDSAVTELDNWKATTKTFKTGGDDTSKFKGWLWLVPVYLYIRCSKTKVNLAPFIIWIVLFILTLY